MSWGWWGPVRRLAHLPESLSALQHPSIQSGCWCCLGEEAVVYARGPAGCWCCVGSEGHAATCVVVLLCCLSVLPLADTLVEC